MGTNKKLTICVLPPLDNWEEIIKLSEQGHTIVTYPMVDPSTHIDLFLGPQCWRMDELHRQYLDMAIKAARKGKHS